MKNIFICLIAIVSPLGAENLFSNGNMNTAGGWKGDGKMVKDEPAKGEVAKEVANRFLVLSAKKNGPVSFRQEVDTKDLITVNLKFRYKTKDYKGPGLEIRGTRMDGGSTYTNRVLKADGEWHQMSWNFTQVAGSKKVDFSVILIQGEGDVAFDDVSAEAAN
ncbi:MAG: hypothetical protein ACRCXD_18425 [Luteolibacter sp.]